MAVEDSDSLEGTPPGETDVAEHAELARALRERVEGGVEFDEYAQVLYATDGSIYQARPAGVVYPTGVEDVRAAVETAAQFDVPVLPRGAGSSLAGQAVGPGCVVLDCSRHMDEILDIDPERRLARVQPGVVQDHLDARLADHGLKFAPDPASSNRATVGGGIGNNSTGAHSVRYGITDAYVEELEVVLADGSPIRTRDVVLDSPEWKEIVAKDDREAAIYETVRALVGENAGEIEARYPELKRSVSGYNLHKVIRETEAGERVINLSTLFAGSEGTLGVVVEATLSLVTVPEETALAVYWYEDLLEALAAVPVALEGPVGGVELMDDEVFRLARESEGYAEYARPVPEGTEAALMLEFDSELVDDFEAAIAETTERLVGGPADGAGTGWPAADGPDHAPAETDDAPDGTGAFGVLEAYDSDEQADLWKLRKAAIPLLMSLEGDSKPYPFIEDASVPPAELAEYVGRFEAILADHDTSAAYFAHAGSGTLHIRPILSLKTEDGVETMHSITDDVTDLVLEYGGSFSGEHGDGMARTAFSPKMYGPELWAAFKELKTAFDPDWQFHPGNVVYRDGPDDPGPDTERGVGADMRENLRYGPAYQSLEPQTTLDFSAEGGFSQLVELCNGCGTCRQTGSDVMCPTYRASGEEIQTTRGRANLLRAAISGELPPEELAADRFHSEVLDLCVGCKGCASDCPTGVDLAKLKAEVKYRYHEEEGVSLRSRLFSDIDRLAVLGSAFAPVSNWLPKVPGARVAMEKTIGIARERELPTFQRQSLHDWYDARGGPRIPESTASARVVLFPDTYSAYCDPEPARAAVAVLEAAGVHVRIPTDLAASGRASYSTGFLDRAKMRARHNVEALAPLVEDGWSVLFVEPSDAVMFQDEYRDLLLGPDTPALYADTVEAVCSAAFGVCEYVDRERLDDSLAFDARPLESVAYHGHCNQKAAGTDHHAVGVLRRAGYEVEPVEASCCGMAGSFGYEAEHYDLSQAIGRLLFDAVDASDGEPVAPGTSCRTQLGDRSGARPPAHPIEKVAAALETPNRR